jgi:N-acyl-D-amino-acid deacylase
MTTLLIKGGMVVDGTGAAAREADVLVEDDRIAALVAKGEGTPSADQVFDASGCMVSPGFIDMHSHADWALPVPDHEELKVTLEQGVTTVVAGNCGFSPAPVARGGPGPAEGSLMELLLDQPLGFTWHTMGEFLGQLEENGLLVNMAELVGHASLRAAASARARGAMPPQELERCLEEARRSLDEGACGLSFGLGYDPGMYSPLEEIEAFCRVAADAGKPATVHLKALSAISPTYRITYLKPHNLRALREMLDIARKTGVTLQVSHFIFVGRRSWRTAGRALEMVEQARRQGVDVMIDAFPFTCGNTTINAPLSYWFLAMGPGGYRSRLARARLWLELEIGFRLVGFVYEDFQVMDVAIDGEEELNGLTIAEIARRRRTSPFDTLLELSEKSKGQTLMLFHSYSGAPGREEALEAVLADDHCLFETDALVRRRGHPNPAATGTFPRVLGEFARERRLFPVEDAIRRMTSASAERFGLRDRGVLAKGMAADLVIFDPERIADSEATAGGPAGRPVGIVHVFLNGRQVVRDSAYVGGSRAGRVLRT